MNKFCITVSIISVCWRWQMLIFELNQWFWECILKKFENAQGVMWGKNSDLSYEISRKLCVYLFRVQRGSKSLSVTHHSENSAKIRILRRMIPSYFKCHVKYFLGVLHFFGMHFQFLIYHYIVNFKIWTSNSAILYFNIGY